MRVSVENWTNVPPMKRTLVLLMLVLMTCPAGAEALQLRVAGTPRQGGVLFVAVSGATPQATGEVRWGNKSYPMAAAGEDGTLRTALPVPVDLRAGNHALRVTVAPGGVVERTVRVASRWFPTQYITLSPATLASYDTPRNRADDKKILDALTRFDAEQQWKGDFRAPCVARQSTAFGVKRLYNGWRKGWHKGQDLAAAEGAPVHAPASGVVLLTARGIVNGNTIVLGHGLGVGTSYFHLSRIGVKMGQRVEKGQVIGYVGGTGGFAPHLHWEARVHGVPVDPHALFAIPDAWLGPGL